MSSPVPSDEDRSGRRDADRARGGWIGGVMTWLHAPARPSSSVVVMLPAVGYDYWSSYTTVHATAEALAAAGHAVLRMDYPGQGDSPGTQDEARAPTTLAAVEEVVRALRTAGFRRVTLLGLRVGAAIAWAAAQELARQGRPVDALVAWLPVDGRAMARELRVLGEDPGPGSPEGSIQVGGSLFTARLLEDLPGAAFDGPCPVPQLWLLGPAPTRTSQRLAEAAADAGAQVVAVPLSTGESYLGLPAEYADPDTRPGELLASALPAAVGPGTTLEPTPRATVAWRGRLVVERVVELGATRLVGVAVSPAVEPVGDASPIVLWVNSGCESHVGPGRAWVEISRDLAARAISSVRLDAQGWGETWNRCEAPRRPYDMHMATDLRDTVEALHAGTGRHVVLAGLCAGAWIALAVQRAWLAPLAGVVAINPQLYWHPGDPVEANIVTETHVRRGAERAALLRLRGDGTLDLLERAGFVHPAAAWLDDLAAAEARTLFLFSGQDDGLEFLRVGVTDAWDRLRTTPGVRVVQVEGLDHGLHRWGLRPIVTGAVADFVSALGP